VDLFTDFEMFCMLDKNTPDGIIHIIEHMLSKERYDPNSTSIRLPSHLLFKTSHWDEMLVGEFTIISQEEYNKSSLTKTSSEYVLLINTCLINDDKEIELFLSFITPYVINTGLCGWMQREDQVKPILIFHENGQFRLQQIIETNETIIE
jgi:hypothetical protein